MRLLNMEASPSFIIEPLTTRKSLFSNVYATNPPTKRCQIPSDMGNFSDGFVMIVNRIVTLLVEHDACVYTLT